MKNRLPRRQELLVLLVLCLICALAVKLGGQFDVGSAVVVGPIFLVAALMGFWRNQRTTPRSTAPAPAAIEVEQPEA